MLIFGIVLFVIGLVGALVNMGYAMAEDASWRGTVWRHVIFGGMYIGGGVMIIIALVMMFA